MLKHNLRPRLPHSRCPVHMALTASGAYFLPVFSDRLSPALELQNSVVAAIGDVQVAADVNVDAVRLIQLHFQRRATDAAGSLLAGAGQADDLSVGLRIFADHVV